MKIIWYLLNLVLRMDCPPEPVLGSTPLANPQLPAALPNLLVGANLGVKWNPD